MEDGVDDDGDCDGVADDDVDEREGLVEREDEVEGGVPQPGEEETGGQEDDESTVEVEGVTGTAGDGNEPAEEGFSSLFLLEFVLTHGAPDEHEESCGGVEGDEEMREGMGGEMCF